MKRILLICAVLAAFSASLFAHDFDSPVFSPVTAEVLGQGGSFTAVAHGYNALFTNPAGFARKGGSFTLLSASVTPYFVPSEGDIDNLGELVGDNPEDGISLLSDLITDNGIGGNVSTGIGIVGKGLGLGLVGGFDFYGRGDYAMATEIDATYTWAAIAGYAVPIEIGFSTLYIGGDLRYMLRAEAQDVAIVDFFEAANGDEDVAFPVYYGSGLAVDAGIIAELGPFNLGLSVRDIGGTEMDYSLDDTGDFSAILTFDDSGASSVDGDTFTIPMTIAYGLSYHPDLGSLAWLLDPIFHMEYRNTYYQESDPSGWTKIHAGTEVKVLKFLKLRGGINQGYFTAGFGMKLLFLDVNLAYFTREMGNYAGSRPNEGFSLEAAIRF
jgi:hypothetical protein